MPGSGGEINDHAICNFPFFSSTFGLIAPGTGAHRLPLFFSSVHDKNAKIIKLSYLIASLAWKLGGF